MSFYKEELETMISKLDDIEERYEDDGINNYDELVEELFEVQSTYEEMKSEFEMEDDCELLSRRVERKIESLRDTMDVFDPNAELESMFDDEELEEMRSIF